MTTIFHHALPLRRLSPLRQAIRAAGLLLAATFACAGLVLSQPLLAADQPPRQAGKSVKVKGAAGEMELGYLLYLPPQYHQQSEQKFPLILFLHGAGERGSNLEQVKRHGPPQLAEQKDLPAIVVSPQCPAGQRWDVEALAGLLDHVEKELRVDPRRIYVTGLSMGGAGTWNLIAHQPDRFAAAAPICGVGDPATAAKIKHIPIWTFHGTADRAVPYAATEKMVAALKEVGGNVKFTTYEGVGHDSWTATYNNPEFWSWLLVQVKPANASK